MEEIPIGTFTNYISLDIENLIHTYGHKTCGLMHKEVCDGINSIITKGKKHVLKNKQAHVKKQFNSIWESQKKRFFDGIFRDLGYKNVCFPRQLKSDSIVNDLISKFIKFCKELDDRRPEAKKKGNYAVCKDYDTWINQQKTQFQRDYLEKVRIINNSREVLKAFRTKLNSENFDPHHIYNSKLDCNQIHGIPKIPKHTHRGSSIVSTQKPIVPSTGHGRHKVDASSLPAKEVGKPKKNENVHHPEATTSHKDNSHAQSPPDSSQSKIQTTSVSPPLPSPASETAPEPPRLPPVLPVTKPAVVQPTPLVPHIVLQPENKFPAPVPTLVQTPVTTLAQTPVTTSAQDTVTTSAQDTVTTSAQDTVNTTSQDTANTTDQDTNKTSGTIPIPVTVATQATAIVTTSSQVTALFPAPAQSKDSTVLSLPTTTTSTTTITVPTVAITATSHETTNTVTSTNTVASTIPIKEITQDGLNPKSSDHSKSSSPDPVISTNLDDAGIASIDSQLAVLPTLTPDTRGNTKTNAILSKPITAADIQIRTSPKNMTPQSKGAQLPKDTRKNDEPVTATEEFPPLTNIIPTILIIFTTFTIFFLLYKYTLLGLFLGRRKRKRKTDLRRIFLIPEEHTYKTTHKIIYESNDNNLGDQILENDAYIKMLKINKYQKAIQKKKKKKKNTLIEVHMEVLEECKKDEWEFHKGDFLEICLRGFISEENETFSNLPIYELTVNNIKNEKTIEDIQKEEILWNNWIENDRSILEEWKKEVWFQILKNEWKKEQKIYQEKIHNLESNIFKEELQIESIVSQKDVWKQWISKQATLIDAFMQKDWFNSLLNEQYNEKDNYGIKDSNDVSFTNSTGIENEKIYYEHYKKIYIIEKIMIQIHMMVLEECIKECIITNKELCIDNIIENIHNKKNYVEKPNISKENGNDLRVSLFEEMNT
ncbi:STP1 protein [Plasmodium ovale wallikeri]|uniref:STP1 protein n=1 Tax=Plasmodium ovale wallikeri TaxID=864142 RepID=A0A1A9AI63_PLAOA|nr:STP1 protein [Plasmodium ovale wallikeri]